MIISHITLYGAYEESDALNTWVVEGKFVGNIVGMYRRALES